MSENRHEAPGPELLSRERGEGSPISRPISDIRADIVAANRRFDLRQVLRLEQELRDAADASTHLMGGKRGD